LRPSLLRRLETPDQRIDCAPELFLADLPRLAAHLADAPPSDALLLIGRRDIRSNNSWMHNAPRLVKGRPRHHLWMHPDDLSKRRIVDGSRVQLRSVSGVIDIEVRADDSVAPGVACLPHGYGHGGSGLRLSRASAVAGASYNDVSDPTMLDAPSGNAGLNALAVWVTPIHSHGGGDDSTATVS
jgi:anaerobic selenocysteine-containing dehydrogenase